MNDLGVNAQSVQRLDQCRQENYDTVNLRVPSISNDQDLVLPVQDRRQGLSIYVAT